MTKMKLIGSALLLVLSAGFSSQLLAEAREQTVRIEVTKPEGGQCTVQAVFKGDHDNCKNDKANGRADCTAAQGCVCTRRDKHVMWKINGKQSFAIAFDQGSPNPFVAKGDNECNLKSNKKGQLRCRVKGKDVTKGDYKYSIAVPECPTTTSHIKIY